ncbi:hypothetical protein T281_09590 [Rhodomicrobium udaipurense JA643]|nr:hypothetical protein T281_09590 [Rhodomicrobium udaipurense JA643]
MLYLLCGATLLASLVLGGGTHSGFLGDVVVQLLSIPLLILALWPAFSDEPARQEKGRIALALCGGLTLVVVLQVLPFPFDIWSGGARLLSGAAETPFTLPSSWTPLSIAPQATWAAAASLVVPLAIFCSVLQLDLTQRMMLCWVVLGFGVVSLALGFIQVAAGVESSLRFFEITNPTEAVGFFANRNHFAALLNVTLVLSALWLNATMESSLKSGASWTRSILWLAAAGTLVVAVLAGLMLARSRAGVFIAAGVLAGVAAMIILHRLSEHTSEEPQHTWRGRRFSLAVAIFAALFAVQFGLAGFLTRFESNMADDARIPLTKTTLETALKGLPFGTGLGSFVPVYTTVEKRADATAGFANRAHNDLAEILLETGIIGVVLLVAFLGWFGLKVMTAWGRPPRDDDPRQVTLARAATLIMALLLAHSLVDYPLRTTALSATFAFFSALLVSPVSVPRFELPKSPSGEGCVRQRHTEAPVGGAWTPGVPWPESWQNRTTGT